jgi:hypothetical protein
VASNVTTEFLVGKITSVLFFAMKISEVLHSADISYLVVVVVVNVKMLQNLHLQKKIG